MRDLITDQEDRPDNVSAHSDTIWPFSSLYLKSFPNYKLFLSLITLRITLILHKCTPSTQKSLQ